MSAHCCEAVPALTGLAPLSLLVVAVIGSGHCVGMCGGIVAAVTRSWTDHVLYHLGRLVGYLALGLAIGSIGQTLFQQLYDQFPNSIGYFVSLGLIVAGVVIAIAPLERLRHPVALPGIQRIFNVVTALPRHWISMGAGLFSIFLPCGLLWMALVAAAAFHHPLYSAGMMGLFWLGTLPAFAALSTLLVPLQNRTKKFFPIAIGLTWVALGIFTLCWRLGIGFR